MQSGAGWAGVLAIILSTTGHADDPVTRRVAPAAATALVQGPAAPQLVGSRLLIPQATANAALAESTGNAAAAAKQAALTSWLARSGTNEVLLQRLEAPLAKLVSGATTVQQISQGSYYTNLVGSSGMTSSLQQYFAGTANPSYVTQYVDAALQSLKPAEQALVKKSLARLTVTDYNRMLLMIKDGRYATHVTQGSYVTSELGLQGSKTVATEMAKLMARTIALGGEAPPASAFEIQAAYRAARIAGARATITATTRTGESLAPRAGGILGGVGLGLGVASIFGAIDAHYAPQVEKGDAFIDAFVMGVPGPTPTYRETYRAVRDGMIDAVKKAPANDPIHDSLLGRWVDGAPAK